MERPAATQTSPRLAAHGDAATARAAAERGLRAPLGAVRVLLEAMRGAAGADLEQLDRILDELTRAERAADDLAAWVAERPLRPTASSVAEVATSLRTTLDAAERARCHVVVEGEDAPMHTDARLLVDALRRSVRHRLSRVDALMVHVHGEGDRLSLTLVDAPDGADLAALGGLPDVDEDRGAPHIAELLLARECGRLGGRASVRVTGEHRCTVAVIPMDLAHPMDPEGAARRAEAA